MLLLSAESSNGHSISTQNALNPRHVKKTWWFPEVHPGDKAALKTSYWRRVIEDQLLKTSYCCNSQLEAIKATNRSIITHIHMSGYNIIMHMRATHEDSGILLHLGLLWAETVVVYDSYIFTFITVASDELRYFTFHS